MHKLVSNKLFNFLFIGTIIMVVFGFQNGHFFIAKAFNNKVNILPGNFSLVQNEGSEMRWQEASNAFIQDLFNDNEFQDFNKQNSTYIVQGEIAEDDIEEIDSLDDSEEKSSSDAVEASEDKETPISSGSSSGGGGSSSQNNSTETQEENKINESDEGDEKANAESLDDIENAGNEEVDEETSVKGIEYPSAMEIDNENNSDSSQESVESKSSEGDDSSEVIDEQEESASSPVEDTLKEPEISSPEPSIPENNSSNSSPTSESQEVSILDGFKSFLSFFNIDSLFSLEEANAENDILSQELIFSDFFVPISVDENNLSNLALNLSFASHSEYNRDSLRIEYKIDEDWNELDELFLEHEISNKDNFGYFSYAFPNSISLDELANLQIRLTYLNPDYLEEGGIELYLDAIWLELEYNSKFEINGDVELQDDEFMDVVFEEAEGETAVVEKNFDLEQLSEKFDFQSRETPKFNFKFSKRKKMLSKIVSAITGIFSDEYDDISIKARVLSSGDDELPVDINIKYIKDGEFELELGELPRHFKPGKQSIEIIIEKNGEIFIDQKDFTWGVFAINFDKSIYLENELAYIQMAVLTDTGDTVCDAKLKIEVESPDGRAQILSTEEGTIYYSGKCGPNNVIDIPDYYAYYNVDEAGIYDVKLTIITDSEERVISDSFKVQESVLFEVERIGPTRIYPWEDYEMKFRILANADYKGTFTEFLPTNFKIVEKKQDGKLLNTEEVADNIAVIEKELVWQIDWKAGHEYILTYTVDFPNISPEFYLLGPAKAEGLVYWEDGEKNKIEPDAIDFVEARQWQIASDDQTSYGTAGAYDFVVPAGVSSITAKIWGAGGGAGGCDDDTVAGGDGGGGGFVTGTIAVTPLETLRVIVGAGGVGGGVGGNNVSGDGGGGGGESALRRGVATYLFVAGSGGGGGGGDDNAGMADGGAGGAGGGNTGVDGADAGSGSAAPGGAGGSQIIGGAGGNSANDYDGTDGGYLSGGNGGGEPVAGGGAGGAPGGGAGGAKDRKSVV